MHSSAARTGTGPVILGLLAVQLFFGVHYLAAKLVLDEMPPRGWAFCRIFFAALVLWGCVALFRRPLPREPRVYVQLAIYALFGVVINQICFEQRGRKSTSAFAEKPCKPVTRQLAQHVDRVKLCTRGLTGLQGGPKALPGLDQRRVGVMTMAQDHRHFMRCSGQISHKRHVQPSAHNNTRWLPLHTETPYR